MIRRTMDATFLNQVANHSEVRPYIGGDWPMDLGPLLANPANIGIEVEHGGWVLSQILPATYDLHTLFLPDGRGPEYFAAAREALRYVFTHTDALEIVTRCPDDNPGARFAASRMGFRERFRREDAWAPGVGISYRLFGVDDWFVRDEACLAAGIEFHRLLKEAELDARVVLPDHPDDPLHDRAAGAASLMIQAGLVAKGMGFYNRWAIFAGYPQIKLLAPNIIDMHEAVVEVENGALRVLLWRPPA